MLTIAAGKELPWFSLPKERVINSMEVFFTKDQTVVRDQFFLYFIRDSIGL